MAVLLFLVVLANPRTLDRQLISLETELYFSVIAICCFCFVLGLQALLVLWYNLRTLAHLVCKTLKSKFTKSKYKGKDQAPQAKATGNSDWLASFFKDKRPPDTPAEQTPHKESPFSKSGSSNVHVSEREQLSLSTEIPPVLENKKASHDSHSKDKSNRVKRGLKKNMSAIKESSLSEEFSVRGKSSERGPRARVEHFDDSDIKISILKPKSSEISKLEESISSQRRGRLEFKEESSDNDSVRPRSPKISDFKATNNSRRESQNSRFRPRREADRPHLNQARRLSYISSNFQESQSNANGQKRMTLISYRKGSCSDDSFDN